MNLIDRFSGRPPRSEDVAMDVNLIALSPAGSRKVIALNAEVTTVGRQTDCNLRVPLDEISRQHCQFVVEGDRVSVKDLGSSNGTFVNDQKVIQRDLNPGDVVRLANALAMMVQIDGQPEQIDESRLRKAKPAPQPPKPKSREPVEPATPFTATTAGTTSEDEADQILSESFFLDAEDEDEE